MKPIEFLMKECHASENDNINYKPYENSNLIQSVPMNQAVQMVEKDIEEMEEFLSPYHLDSKAEEAAYHVWKSI